MNLLIIVGASAMLGLAATQAALLGYFHGAGE